MRSCLAIFEVASDLLVGRVHLVGAVDFSILDICNFLAMLRVLSMCL